MNIAIFGGSFNPPAKNHIEVVELLLKNVPWIDEIRIQPQYKDPLGKELIACNYRLEMCQLAFKDIINENPNKISLSSFEIDNKITDGTYLTYKYLNLVYPNDKFYWVIGSDCLMNLPNWNFYPFLKEEVEFLLVTRHGYSISDIEIKYRSIGEIYSISSTHIRKNIGSLPRLVEQKMIHIDVANYIKDYKLYQN